ncbi:phage tail tape measure protein [Staphylococcus hominis]|uniref:phage tail tape measure protein n=1 Tax=Staphylococcus hominis TaxID=1290 RepID=UPI0025551E07|nr:phage tail tape measure protein [Staphylococcus hominis]MDK7928841.1 phage tail tape measure protein [Staphylococcus hominis]MDS3883830.1 phage tail tape measure protein [Staphylococcus hominis]MDS3883892.1 phage tail tape measure protein [Staphylococcus hominis]
MAERIKGLQIDLSMQDMGIGSTLAGIRRSFRQLNSDLKLSSNNFKYSEKSMTSYKNRIRELDAATKQQRNNVKELRNQYMQTAKEQGANSAKAVRLRTEYNKQADTLNRLEHELDQTVDGFKRFQKEAQEAARVSNSSFGRLGQKFTDIGPKLTSVGESMKNVGRSMSMYVTAPIVAGFGLAAKKSIDFDDSMRKVKATSGATGGEFQQLRDKALEMGAKTKFSASESAEALNYMALAGWDTKDMLGGIDGVMQLAAASGEDLGAVSDIVTDSLTAFGMKAKDSGRFADVLAQTSSKANTDVRGLGEAFKYAAPVAGALGYTVEDTSIAIGLMSNAGIKGEKAGTALRTMFTNLAKPTKAMKDKMEELGISITDSNGKMLPMRDVMGQLRNKFKGLSKDQQASAAATIFGKEAMSGALAVINASDEDYKKLTKSIDNSTGASKRMSDEMEGGIGGSIRKMKSAIESLAISIGDVLAPHIRKAADFLAMLADKFTNMPGWVKTGVVGLGIFAAALGPLILTTGAFTAALGSIMTTIGPVMTDITKAGGLMNFLGTKAPFAAKGLTLVGGAFKFMLGPVGLAIAAIVAIGTAFVIAYKKSETFRNIVNTVIGPVVNAFKNLRNTAEVVFNALKNLFSGNTLPTVDILSKIMPKATAIKVTATLMQIRQVFIDVFNAIWQFGQDIGLKLGQFWNQNGATIMQAVTNIWNTIVTVFTEVKNFLWPILQELGGIVKTVFMNVIVPAVKIGMQIIWGVMKFLWPLIKTLVVDTWNNIKNIINGALDIILGIVKIFSGLFTGQWKQVWNGIKQVFSGALTLIWNLIQLWFIGKILKVVKIFGGFFKSIISKAFNGVKTVIGTVLKFIWSIISTIFKRILSITRSIFGAVLKFIRFIFNSIKNFISKTVKAIYNNVKKWFTSVWNVTKAIFGKLKNWVIKLWSSIKNKVVGFAKGLYNGVKNRWNALWSVTKSIFNRLKNWVVKLWSSLKNKVIGLAKSLWNGVKNRWNALWNGTRSIFNKVKNFMSSVWRNIKNTTVRLAKALWSSVKGTWNSLSNGTRNIFNKVKSFMSNTWRSIKNTTVNMAKSLWNSVRRTFNNMAGGLKNIIGKIKGHITGMVKAVKEGLNKLIGGVNWVADKIGMKKLPTFKFHTGTESTHTQNLVTNGKLNRNTLATVGDKGKGNGPGGFRHETIIPPKGKPFITPAKDTTMPLSKGTRILNGAQTHAMLSNGMTPKFNTGTIPRFASGTKKKLFQAVGETAGKFFNSAKKLKHNAMDSIGDKTKQAKEWGGEKLSQIKGAVGKGTKWLSDKVGDIADWVGKPGKLLNKVLGAFGVNMDAFGIAKSAEIPYNLMKAMFGKLKEAAKNLIDGWLEDEFGGGGGYNPYTKAPFHMTRGWTPSGHAGIDYGAPTGTPIPSPIDGKVIQSWFSPNQPSGGNETQIWDGQKYTHIFMHQSKRKVKTGDRVRQGEIIGLVGNTGNSFGSHLHWQVNKEKGYTDNHPQSIDPLKWAKAAAKSGGGVNKAASAWKPDIRRAAKAIGVRVSNADVNDVARLIQTESSGNAGVTQQIQDKNSGGNEAQGLLQYTPGSFNSYAIRGHKNIKNGYDQLLAFFNNTDWRANLSYWKRRMASGLTGWGPTGSRKKFATGGLIKSAGWYNIAEGGYPEWVIPTDPNRRTDAMKLLALAAKDIEGSKTSGNKRPSNFSSAKISSSQSDNSKLEQKLDMLIGLMSKLVQSNDTIANKDFELSLDGKELSKNNSKQQALKAATQLMGG